jgi:hypothetical protein
VAKIVENGARIGLSSCNNLNRRRVGGGDGGIPETIVALALRLAGHLRHVDLTLHTSTPM